MTSLAAALLVALHLDVRDLRRDAGGFSDADGLGNAGAGAVALLGRQALVVLEARAPRRGGAQHRDYFFGSREVGGTVIEPAGDAEGAATQVVDHERTHALELRWRRAAIAFAHHRGPHAVEADISAEVLGEPVFREGLELPGDIELALPVGVDDLGGDTLLEHVLRSGDRARHRVTVDIDEARRDEQTAGVDLQSCGRARQVADARDVIRADADIGHALRRAAAIQHGAVADDHLIVGRIGGNCAGRRRSKGREDGEDR